MQRTKLRTHVQFGIDLKVLLPHTMSIPSYVTVLVIMSATLAFGLQSEGPTQGGLLTTTAAVVTAPREARSRAPHHGSSLDTHSNAGHHRTTSETESVERTSPTNVIQSDREHSDSTKEHHSDSTHSSSVIHDNGHGVAPPAETRGQRSTAHVRDSVLPSRLSDLAPAEQKQVLSSLESSFLNIVGLSSRPRPGKPVTVPPYMLELYREYMEDREGRRPRSRTRPGLHGANTIRGFQHLEDQEDRLPEGIAHLKFNLTSLPGDETLQACELRLHREASNLQNQLHINASSAALDELLRSRHRIDVYQVMLPPQPSSGREPVTRLLDTRVVQPATSGWETFDVTQAVESWRTGTKNYGLEVRFSKVSGESSPLHHVRLKRSNRDVIRSEGRDQSSHKSSSQSSTPLLVTYTQSPRGASTNDGRHRREARRKHRDTTRRGKSRPNRQGRKRRRDKPRRDRDYKKNCRRRELYVDFGDVGWTDWIVAPPGYEAYFCYGECPFHMAEHFNTTNHAVVQQFVHSVDPQSVPKACCVPTELSEVALLYIDEEENVLLRRYEEMVVEACGCR